MPAVRNSTDLVNNFNEILNFCQNYREPIFLTSNGQEQLAVMSKDTYEEITGKQNLYYLLEEGLKDLREGRILTEEEMYKSLDSM